MVRWGNSVVLQFVQISSVSYAVLNGLHAWSNSTLILTCVYSFCLSSLKSNPLHFIQHCTLFFMQVLDTDSANFSLVRLYPRQELTTDMDLQSMVDLKLAPSGVIIVKVNKVWFYTP